MNYAFPVQTLAFRMAGDRPDWICPDCGAGRYRTERAAARMNARVSVAREIALDMTGNLDAPL